MDIQAQGVLKGNPDRTVVEVGADTPEYQVETEQMDYPDGGVSQVLGARGEQKDLQDSQEITVLQEKEVSRGKMA